MSIRNPFKSPLAIYACIVLLLCVGIFIKLSGEILQKEPLSFDQPIVNAVSKFRSPPLTQLMIIITSLGNSLVLGIAILITTIFIYIKHGRYNCILAVVLLSGTAINMFLKLYFERPRPQVDMLIFEPTYSFPSGHAMNAMIFYLSLIYLVVLKLENPMLKFILTGISITSVALIGISRVYLGVHYPSDVLAGYAAGIVWVVSVIMISKAFKKNLSVKKNKNGILYNRC